MVRQRSGGTWGTAVSEDRTSGEWVSHTRLLAQCSHTRLLAEPSTGQSSVAPSPPPAAEASPPELRGEQQEMDEHRRSSVPSFPDTCYTEGYEYSYEASVLHRQLKRSIMSGAAGEGLSAYRAMERYFLLQSFIPTLSTDIIFLLCLSP